MTYRRRGWELRLLIGVLLIGTLGCASVAPTSQPVEAEHRAVSDPLAALLGPAVWPDEVTADAPALDVVALERAIHDAVNRVRAAHGLAALAWDTPLVSVARSHSGDMARQAFFGHVNLRGEDATARAERVGITSVHEAGTGLLQGVGENLFLTHRYDEYRRHERPGGDVRYEFEWKDEAALADEAVAAWLASRTHRDNILCPAYRSGAVGVVLGDNETVYITHNFSFRAGTSLAAAR